MNEVHTKGKEPGLEIHLTKSKLTTNNYTDCFKIDGKDIEKMEDYKELK